MGPNSPEHLCSSQPKAVHLGPDLQDHNDNSFDNIDNSFDNIDNAGGDDDNAGGDDDNAKGELS